MKICRKFTILLYVSALIFSACAGNREQQSAEETVASFYRLYNEQNHQEIYKRLHDDSKRGINKDSLGHSLNEAFEKSGKFVSSDLVYKKILPIANSKEKQVELIYKSQFEKATRNDSFLILTDGEKAALYWIGELTDEEIQKLKSK